jgi:hypothetical protein
LLAFRPSVTLVAAPGKERRFVEDLVQQVLEFAVDPCVVDEWEMLSHSWLLDQRCG